MSTADPILTRAELDALWASTVSMTDAQYDAYFSPQAVDAR